MEERLRGLVHLLSAQDKAELAFLDIAKPRFRNCLSTRMLVSGQITKLVDGVEQSISLLRLIEEIEGIIEIKLEDRLAISLLIEVRIPPINDQLLDHVFQIIDAVQRVCLHYDLPDRSIKLFYISSAETGL